jgi:hypothetical protein
MEYVLIGIIGTFIWVAYEIWRAPMMDERTGKTIRPAKKLKDLFKKNDNKHFTR